jgi:hypothetical protein
VILAAVAAALNATATFSTLGETGASTGAAAFGFTVMIGVPWVTCAVTT